MIPERCGGSGRIGWSDDSYAYYNEPCGGCPDCKEEVPVISKTEAEEARRDTPSVPKIALTVSIPVTVGGYVGQRDQWHEYERDYAVTLDGDKVTLKSGQSDGGQFSLSREGLKAALRVLEDYRAVPRG